MQTLTHRQRRQLLLLQPGQKPRGTFHHHTCCCCCCSGQHSHNGAWTSSQNALFFSYILIEQPDFPPEIMRGLQKASPLNPQPNPHPHHGQQWSTVLLSEASDVEMQVCGDGDGDTEVRLCSSLDVQLWLWFFSEHAGPHLAAGDVLDVLDVYKEQRQVTLFMLSGNTQHLHLFQCWLCMLFICSLTFEGNWKNLKWAKLKHQQVCVFLSATGDAVQHIFYSINNMDLCPVSRQSIVYFSLLAPNPNAQFCREAPCDVTKCSKSLTYLPLNLLGTKLLDN